jgi:hypothetical protein
LAHRYVSFPSSLANANFISSLLLEAKWTAKVAKVVRDYSACFDRIFSAQQPVTPDDFPKIARFVGGVASYEMALRAKRQVALGPDGALVEDSTGWGAFVLEYGTSYLDKGELIDVPERKRMELAEEQDQKVGPIANLVLDRL